MARIFPNAATDYLVNASSSPVTGAGPWTMACWARPVSLAWPSSFGCPMNLARNAALHLGRFTVGATGALTFQVYDGANGAAAAGNMSAGAWGHLVGVKRSATNQQAYLNGTGGSVNTTSVTPIFDRISVGICRYTGTSVIYPWNGGVAWPAVWNVALSDAEITALARGAHPYTIRPQNLVWFAPLHGGTAGDIDVIGGLNLTEVGAVTEGESPLVARGGAIIIPFPAATGADHDLLADDLSTTPTLTEPSIGQTHVLAADDVATTATLTEPALGQVHALTADDLATTPTLTEPALATEGTDALSAEDLATTPTLTQAALGQVHALTADDISTTPTLGEPVLAVGPVVLYAEDLQIVVTLPQPQLGQIHALTAEGISTTPALSMPALDGEDDAFGMLYADVRVTPALRARAQVAAALQASARITTGLRGRVRLQ